MEASGFLFMSTNEFIQSATKRIAKKAEIKEEDIESHYVKYAKRKGCVALKLIFLNRKGFPDRTTLCPGAKILFIEFKRKGKKPSLARQTIQKKIQKQLQRFGFEYYVCDEIGQAEKHLDRILNDTSNLETS